MRINLDIEDENLSPEAREVLLGLLHRLEKEPEHFMSVARDLPPAKPPLAPGELKERLRKARADRAPVSSITPQEFFSEILKTKGFESKEAAHQHILELRAEWS